MIGLYLLKNSREMRRAQSARPRGMRDANFLPWMALCREAQDGRERLLRIPKGGACPPLLKSYIGFSHHRRAMAFLEIVIAVLLMGILVGPLIQTVSSINRGTASTVYELMAAQYASELLEQVHVLPVASILMENHVSSMNSLCSTLDIPLGEEPINKVKLCSGVFLMVSAMPKEIFVKRILTFESETRTVGTTAIQVGKATVAIEWKIPGTNQEKKYIATTFLLES